MQHHVSHVFKVKCSAKDRNYSHGWITSVQIHLVGLLFCRFAELSKFHILLCHTISTHQQEVFEWIFNGKLTQFWQSNTRHTVTKQAKAMFWHLRIVSQIVWIRVCFLCRGKESRARTTSGPGDRIAPNMLSFSFLYPPPPPPTSSSLHNP